MDKAAKSVAGTFRHAKRVLQTSPALRKGLIGGAIGTVTGGGAGHLANKAHENSSDYKKSSPEKKKKFQKSKKWGVGVNAVVGGVGGAMLGHDIGKMDTTWRNINKGVRGAKGKSYKDYDFGFGGRSSSREAPPIKTKDIGTPDWLKGVKTKGEAKSKFRQQAGQHHPDRGGDENKMKKVNAEWDSFQKHHFHKLSFVLPGFLDELGKIHSK